MNPILKKILAPRYEYLTLDRNFSILETSLQAQRFADCPDQLILGNDVRVPFPELWGVEESLIDILEGRQAYFELKGIARTSTTTHPLYIDLYISESSNPEELEKRLIVLLEDATERMLLQQTLAQRTNEMNLLISSLAASKNYIDRIITSMADALLVTTASGIIKTVNQCTQDLFGYNQDELIDQPISSIINNKDFVNKINQISSSAPGEFIKDLEVACQTKAGKPLVIAFSCSVIQTEISGLQNFVYVGRDISERKRLEAEMIKAIERERELRELKSDFVSMASHEFRTPLTAIFSSSELLQHYSQIWSDEKKFKHYHRIEAAVKRMIGLLDDVLLYSKAEAGKLEFNPKPLKLRSFCSDVVEEVQLGMGEKHNITFVYSGSGNNACMDEKLLQHILTNLLSNAVKYSTPGSTVLFGCYCEGETVTFEIKDEGIGIPPEDQARLFESFHRAKNVGDIPGTGLGLAIVGKSLELHGGKVALKSEVGVGTTFRVTLPLHSRKQDVLAECFR
ncbi:MAG: PAS domain-containing sensor histidine kinase [Cyanobacteriota bacterium]